MSCNYAEGLSEYEDKGVLGVAEVFDSIEETDKKCSILSDWINKAKHVVVHTGAGISTSAGIPDFRGPNGVWTLEKEGKKPVINISFDEAKPTKTHMALKKLVDNDIVKYVISQNIDGLHLKSGIPRKKMAELHGNMFTEKCNTCGTQFVRNCCTSSVGQKLLGTDCRRIYKGGRPCRGKLKDTILDWEDNLPDMDLEMSDYHSRIADLNICLGSTLQIMPSGHLPIKNKKFGGKVVVINLQPTKQDKKADLIINNFVDVVMEKVMQNLLLKIPEYNHEEDPTKSTINNLTWDISRSEWMLIKKIYNKQLKESKQKKIKLS